MTSPVMVPYQYLVLRCVPRVDRQEFVNVGVVLYSQRLDFLSCASHLDPARLRALDPDLDLEAVREALTRVGAICRGDESAGSAATVGLGARFGHLAAPRSTVVQPGPVHGGVLTQASPEPAGVPLQHLPHDAGARPARSASPPDARSPRPEASPPLPGSSSEGDDPRFPIPGYERCGCIFLRNQPHCSLLPRFWATPVQPRGLGGAEASTDHRVRVAAGRPPAPRRVATGCRAGMSTVIAIRN